MLYDLDTRRDLLVQQSPPNAGTLVTVGGLGLPAGSVAGFDIVSTGATNTAYAAITFGVTPYTVLARVDLATGRTTVTGVAALPNTLRDLAA